MREHPMFICAREGHDTPLKFSSLKSTLPGATVVQECRRCGAAVETKADAA